MIWTIPNILTIIRLLAAPGLALMFLYFDRPYADWFALLLFLLASITDWFDGYLARIWRQETKRSPASLIMSTAILRGDLKLSHILARCWIQLPIKQWL